ncbi:hypothetical protein [Hymenobacter arizonensis]|uniref:Uncharacterized protein n=1 Tax=Hymenobacter arizonensis TaxID=1227077 RepID=A0A1I5ZNR9_HYMAR|nr:hypothetical protein [Hymenobacter arizonensis]SFQ58126.1 hypothetical protein SAMN04515668_3075 [Hymenobacter arizonensis]
MTLTRSISFVALGTALLLLIPLTAKLFLAEMAWSVGDFVAAGIMLFGSGLMFVLIARMSDNTWYRLGTAVGVGAGLMLVWANLAVGLVGSEHNPANLLYVVVLAVALIGAFVARFHPHGMSNAMFAASLTYVLVTAIALYIWKPTGAAAEPNVGLVTVLAANGLFAAVWAFAGLLFRRASTSGSKAGPRLA